MNDEPLEAAAEALFFAESGRWMSWCYATEYSRLANDTKDAYRDAARQVVEAYLAASAAHLGEKAAA